MANYCYECGTELKRGARFCAECGRASNKGIESSSQTEYSNKTDAQKNAQQNTNSPPKIRGWLLLPASILIIILIFAPFAALSDLSVVLGSTEHVVFGRVTQELNSFFVTRVIFWAILFVFTLITAIYFFNKRKEAKNCL